MNIFSLSSESTEHELVSSGIASDCLRFYFLFFKMFIKLGNHLCGKKYLTEYMKRNPLDQFVSWSACCHNMLPTDNNKSRKMATTIIMVSSRQCAGQKMLWYLFKIVSSAFYDEETYSQFLLHIRSLHNYRYSK